MRLPTYIGFMKLDLVPEFSAYALGWPVALLELLGPTQTIEVSSGWLLVLIIVLWVWRDRLRR